MAEGHRSRQVPDPVEGDPTSGVMADDADSVFTGVCEVCHTVSPGGTTHHTNDGTHTGTGHNNALDCTACHPHDNAFSVSGSRCVRLRGLG